MAQHILSGIEEALGTIYGSVERIRSGIEEVLGTIHGSVEHVLSFLAFKRYNNIWLSRAYSFWH